MNWMVMFLAMAVVAAVLLVMYLVTSTNLDIANKRIRLLESDTQWLKAEANHLKVEYAESQGNAARLSFKNMELSKQIKSDRVITSDTNLTAGLSGLIRFIGANQWLLEKDKDFLQAVASVGEVAQEIEERNEA